MEENQNSQVALSAGSRLARSVKEAGGARWSGGGLWWLLRGKSIYSFGSLINKLIMIIQIIVVINPKQPNPCGIRSRNVNEKCPECNFACVNQNPDLIR